MNQYPSNEEVAEIANAIFGDMSADVSVDLDPEDQRPVVRVSLHNFDWNCAVWWPRSPGKPEHLRQAFVVELAGAKETTVEMVFSGQVERRKPN